VQNLPLDVVHATEVLGMREKAATAVRSKRDSSMRVGLRLVREGRAAGFVTAGNTGAAMTAAKMVLGALPGVDRPALAMVFPTSAGTPCILVDVGANVDCKPHNISQFAVMGEMYYRAVFGKKRPTVGLLSRRAFVDFKKRLDYSEYGGAPLLGIRGVAIVGHGASNANAIKNAIRVTTQFAESGINERIEMELTGSVLSHSLG